MIALTSKHIMMALEFGILKPDMSESRTSFYNYNMDIASQDKHWDARRTCLVIAIIGCRFGASRECPR